MLGNVDVWSSVSLCSVLCGLFVASLYLVDLGLPRNHPTTVKRRILAVGVVCLVAPLGLYVYICAHLEAISVASFVSLLGLKWEGLLAAVCCPTILVLTLYSGPIFQNWVDGSPLFGDGVMIQRKDVILRNYFIAPLAEEWIFRTCMLLLLRPAVGDAYAVLVCPIFFGIAHIHHIIDWYRINDGTSFKCACLSVIVQIMYTSTFGLFAGFLFIRTNHFISLVLCHSLCNLMGLPPLELALDHPKRHCILLAYFFGAILFCSLLFPLTSPSLYV
jgi:prenyl protein peptidase